MYSDNNWYGHRRILADYCGVKDNPIYATLLHGWIWEFKGTRGQRRIKSAPYLAWNERQFLSAKLLGVENVLSIGSPFLYLNALIDAESDRVGTRAHGTLFFPQHSTSINVQPNKHLLYRKYIESKYPPPYTVSLFFLEPDFNKIKNFYMESGWQVFCAGPRDSAQFLKKIWDAIESNAYVVSNDLSTSLFYAAYKGKRVYLDPLSKIDFDEIIARESGDDYKNLISTLYAGISGRTARNLGENELGEKFFLSGSELKKVVGWSNFRRKYSAKLISILVDMKNGRSVRKGDSDL